MTSLPNTTFEEDSEEDENAWTPLQTASHDGNEMLVTSLLEKGADANALPRGWYGKTALQAASQNGHLDVVKRLVEAGADINSPGGNNGGHTALTAAAGSGHGEIVDFLIAEGAPHEFEVPKHPE